MEDANHEWPSSSYNEPSNAEIRDVLMTNSDATLTLARFSSGEWDDAALSMSLATNNRTDWPYGNDIYDSGPGLPVEEPCNETSSAGSIIWEDFIDILTEEDINSTAPQDSTSQISEQSSPAFADRKSADEHSSHSQEQSHGRTGNEESINWSSAWALTTAAALAVSFALGTEEPGPETLARDAPTPDLQSPPTPHDLDDIYDPDDVGICASPLPRLM